MDLYLERPFDTTKAVAFKEILPISADTVIIINSDEDLKSYCDKNSSFDFTKGSLLITCGNTTYGVANISVRLTRFCVFILSKICIFVLISASMIRGGRKTMKDSARLSVKHNDLC